MISTVEIFSVGSSGTTTDLYRYVAAGAAPDGDLDGFVEVREASLNTSLMVAGSPSNMQLLPSDFGAAAISYQFGAELLAANVSDCRQVGVHDFACGEELLVGAPDWSTHSSAGRVYFYEPGYDPVLVPAGELLDPSGILGAEFGSSMAISQASPPANTPWAVGDLSPEWLAVGAPGDGRVEVFSVDPLAASAGGSPFTAFQTFTSTGKTAGFGSEVLFEDLNHDGFDDLVVGAPKDSGGGWIQVFPWVDGAGAFHTTGFTVAVADTSLPTPILQADEFGSALAAGALVYEAGGSPGFPAPGVTLNALVVGVPGYDLASLYDSGAVCQFTFEQDSSDPTNVVLGTESCFRSPGPGLALANGRLGESVAVGNFVAIDSNYGTDSPAAQLRDVAIGWPGAGVGVLLLNHAQENGIDWTVSPPQILHAPVASAGPYAVALNSGYVAETQWEDLVIGEPGDDRAWLTLAAETSTTSGGGGACAALDGIYTLAGQEWVGNDNTGTGAFFPSQSEVLLWEDGVDTFVAFRTDHFMSVGAVGDTSPCVYDFEDVTKFEDETGDAGACGELSGKAADVGRYMFATNAIPKGTVLTLPGTCAAAFDALNSTYEYSGVVVGPVIEHSLKKMVIQLPLGASTDIWSLLTSDSKAALAAHEATVFLAIDSATGNGSVDIDMNWADIWFNIEVGVGSKSCNFGHESSCVEPSPLSSGSPEFPAAATLKQESVCEG